jgi:hypothetical protein
MNKNKEKPLHQIMNDIAGRLDAICPAHEMASSSPLSPTKKKKRAPLEPLGEMEAFMQLDPLLADLQRQYIDAKLQRQELCKAHGDKDPMSEIAMDMEDSAWCAAQTRYIELRQIRDMMAKVQRLMHERDEEIALEKRKEQEKDFMSFFLLAKAQEKMRERQKGGGYEYAVLLLMFNLLPTVKHVGPAYQRPQMAAA